MSYCMLHIFCVSRKGERVRGGDRWGHPQGAVWIAGARTVKGPQLTADEPILNLAA